MDKYQLDVFIEISKNSSIKYEYDKKEKCLRCDRILKSPFVYPENYGYIPNTLAEDNDELDALVLSRHVFMPGIIIRCKILGFLLMTDEKGLDEKMLVMPIDDIDEYNKEYNDITDVPNHIIDKIAYFFTHYKDLDENKWSKVEGVYGRDDALALYEKYKKSALNKKTSISKIKKSKSKIIKSD